MSRIRGARVKFSEAIHLIATCLEEEHPPFLNPMWIARHCPKAYRFISKAVRTELDQIDWDKVTAALPRRFQQSWCHSFDMRRLRTPPRPYRNQAELNLILTPYQDKTYTFLTSLSEDDNAVRETIAIRLVRLAQNGNSQAKELILALLNDLVDQWIEYHPRFSRWKCDRELLQRTIVRCIHRYRYTGSFVRYLFRSLEYGNRRLRTVEILSLDEVSPFTGKKRLDMVVRDSATNVISIFTHAGYHLCDAKRSVELEL
jgi:hypothetical protein